MIHQGEREARIKTYSNDYQREATRNIICFYIRGGHWQGLSSEVEVLKVKKWNLQLLPWQAIT